MTRDINVLRTWLLIVVVIASAAATAVPIVYARCFYWRKYMIGRLFMMQAIAFAAALDMTVLFQFWQPKDILILFWIQAMIFTAMALSTSLIVWLMLRFFKKGRNV